jgi:nucleoside-diphosphate-sugar epimerase
VQALRCALLDVRASSWSIHHIGYDSDSYVPLDSAQLGWPGFAPPIRYPHPAAVSSPPGLVQIPARAEPIRTVIIFGAGGPLGAAVTRELSSHYTLRLADLKPIDDLLATQQPQSAGAPLAERPQPPHSWLQVDVRDRAQVMAACASMDAIINLSVIRNDLAGDFQVNMLGARHIMEAAVTHGIQRVVHTGPFQLGTRGPLGYDWDYTIVDDVPARPGTDWIYFLSKLCGQELVKIYAHAHGLSVPALTFCEFLNPDVIQMHNIHPLSVSWPDSARAIRAALEVQTLPSPFEYFHIGAPLPHGISDVSKAERLLGWRARDMLEVFYRR